jgi:hypothetical protein
MDQQRNVTPEHEPFHTLKGAAEALGIPCFKMQRAARQGMIPTYRFYNGRQYVRLTEIVALMEHSRD